MIIKITNGMTEEATITTEWTIEEATIKKLTDTQENKIMTEKAMNKETDTQEKTTIKDNNKMIESLINILRRK